MQAQTNTWLTEAQVELAQNIVATQAIGPMLKKFGDSLTYHPPDELDPLTEVDDMTRVDFECHPTEPVKVLDTWDKPVRCLICGRPNFSCSHCGSGCFSTKTSTPAFRAPDRSRTPSSSIFSASTLPTGADRISSCESK